MKKIFAWILTISLIATPISSLAHSGRTDGSGGHRDNKNASGLGSYHYHHGYGPHLHTGNICPYDVEVVVVKKVTPTKSTTYKSSTSSSKKSFNVSLQRRLSELGYNCGTPDGVVGKKTKTAIKAFQQDYGLLADGIVGIKTRSALGF